MDLKSGLPYFLVKDGLLRSFLPLDHDLNTDVLILGGGITGALMAHELVERGIECAIIDGRTIGLGSTCASTGLLQYEIDIPLHELSAMIGVENAERAYKMCSEAIEKLYTVSLQIGYDEFVWCSSLHFAHSRFHKSRLEKEYQARKAAGFEVEMLGRRELSSRYGLKSSSAIISARAARMNTHRFIHKLYEYNIKRGLKVYDNTYVESIQHSANGVSLITGKGHKIKAQKMVYATGYESVQYTEKKVGTMHSTYAFVSKPLPHLPAFFTDTVMWNTDDPYLYIRSDENRLIIGGRDETFYNPSRRDKLIDRKAQQLSKDLSRILKNISIEIDFAWTGTFGSTKDALPYIGIDEKLPNGYFALGYGGNGITFSALAAEIIADLITGKKKEVDPLFRFDR